MVVAIPHKGRAGASGSAAATAVDWLSGADGLRLPVGDEGAAAALVVPRTEAESLEVRRWTTLARVVAPGGVVAMLDAAESRNWGRG